MAHPKTHSSLQLNPNPTYIHPELCACPPAAPARAKTLLGLSPVVMRGRGQGWGAVSVPALASSSRPCFLKTGRTMIVPFSWWDKKGSEERCDPTRAGAEVEFEPGPSTSKCHAPEIPFWSRGLRPQRHALPSPGHCTHFGPF